MAGKHGKRCYYQLLLQPNRAALIEAIAKEKQVRATELIRQFVYESLERELPRWEYASAVEADKQVWDEAVRNRVAGRAARRKKAEEAFKAKTENVPE